MKMRQYGHQSMNNKVNYSYMSWQNNQIGTLLLFLAT